MKKMLCIGLSLLVLIGISACDLKNGGESNPSSGKIIKLECANIAIGASYTDFEGVKIQIAGGVWSEDEIRLDLQWINYTPYDVLYGENFYIERETEEGWEGCEVRDDIAFHTIGYKLATEETKEKTYVLTDTYDIRKNGKYRLRTDCLVFDKEGDQEGTECDLWIKFVVETVDKGEDEIAKTSVCFASQIIRTNGYHEGVEYPVVTLIRSVEELNAYYLANKDKYDLEHKDTVYGDTTIGFVDACAKYDEEYFEDQVLVMVLLEEGSGSIRHVVDRVDRGSEGKLYISIRSIVPEMGTDDMAEWHILIEPEANGTVASASDIIVYVNGVNPKTEPAIVREETSFSNITLAIPYNWEYETEYGENPSEYCISFWPEEYTEGKIKLWYKTEFGVCGTDLETEKIMVGRYEAEKGTYGNKKVWDFINFIDMPGSYVVINEGIENWWDVYGEEAMDILATVRMAEGVITEEQVVELAKKDVTVEYNQIDAVFNPQNGLWTVSFFKRNTAGGNQVFIVTHEGKILRVEYGE